MKNRTDKMISAMEKVLKGINQPVYGTDAPLSPDSSAELNFIVWGDPQISAVSPLRSARVFNACKDIKNAIGKFDALVMAGDITEYGARCEYNMITYLLNPVADKLSHIFAVSGNHDVRLRNYKKQVRRFSEFLANIKNGVPNSEDKYFFSYMLNGYKFVFLGSDRSTFEAMYLSGAQLQWLDSELKNAPEGKPVFVFNHQPIKRTNGLPVTFLGRGKWRGSVGWESDRLRAVFEKYNNVIYITGHLHYCTSQYTYEDCGAFKAVNVPTVGVINHGSFKNFTQGLVFAVYKDEIRVLSRIFGEGRYSPEEISNSRFTIKLNK
ncbi:MAG: metallophosphoesterase [Ruminococcaceae bacterium]|nr:metallophosphoesterase [Oscillospiraceae bacterium]